MSKTPWKTFEKPWILYQKKLREPWFKNLSFCLQYTWNWHSFISFTLCLHIVPLGSEYDSDENFDIAEDEDILEMEEGDKDVQIPESELRDQVGRVHL